MGNEVSRGLSPGGGLPPSPHTPTGAVRRTKSFSTDATISSAASVSATHVDRSIQRMDKTIRKRVRGSITYNMKIVLRGDRGTGKTSLFQRLKGTPIPATHEPTPQLQSATINWNFRANSEESVKCDVWDVVDKGFIPNADGGSGAIESNRFESAAAASASTSGQANGNHAVATADATTVDVYHETHGVVFLLDVTKPHTLEYVRQQLDHVPVHIPTLVLGNFRDCGAQRKIFKEDIQELLYGGGTTQHQPMRRPQELLYFECSLLNCYGLKSLHQYFGIPFLQLKQHTIRQQLRIVEGEFTHLKHDLQAKIASQKYADYMEHIKSTGSDIRTGRRGSGATAPAPAVATTSAAMETASNGDETLEAESPMSKYRLDRTMSSSSDIVIQAEPTTSAVSSEPPVTPTGTSSEPHEVHLEDLPDRTAALTQTGNRLKIAYTEEERRAAKRQPAMPPLPGMPPVVSTTEEEQADTEANAQRRDEQRAQQPTSLTTSTKKSPDADLPMNLEDFQVPKPRLNDLDNFYSDEESEEEVGDDDDVVISTASARLAKSASAKYHKQQFLDSDDSDSGGEKRSTQRKAPAASPTKQRSTRRHVVTTTPSSDEHASGASGSASPGATPFPPLPMRPSSSSAVSPRSPTSPPRPQTTSPQFSPRRRIKEIPTAVVVQEESSDLGIVVTESQKQLPPTVDASDEIGQHVDAEEEVEEETHVIEAQVDQHIELSNATPDRPSTDDQHGAPEKVAQVGSDDEDSPTAKVPPNGQHSASALEASRALDRVTDEGQVEEALQEVNGSARSAASQAPRAEIVDDSKSEVDTPGPAIPSSNVASVFAAAADPVSIPVAGVVAEEKVASATVDLVSIPSPLLAPVTSGPGGGLGDILEAFLNDSSSESEESGITKTSASKMTMATTVEESDEEDDAEDERFAAYDRKRRTERRGKTTRRQQFSEIVVNDDTTTTVSLSSSQTSSFSTTSENTARASSSIANQDVLAAIRQAEQDALRMLEVSTSVASAGTREGNDATVKKKKSSSHSSSRTSTSMDDAMEGSSDVAGTRKKPKKKREKKSGTSSRSKRREMIFTDEDE